MGTANFYRYSALIEYVCGLRKEEKLLPPSYISNKNEIAQTFTLILEKRGNFPQKIESYEKSHLKSGKSSMYICVTVEAACERNFRFTYLQ